MNEPTAVADRRVAESGADEWRRASPEAAGNGNIIIGKLLFLLCWVASYSVVRRKNILFVFMMKVGGSRSGGLGPGNSWTMGDVDHIFLWREGGGGLGRFLLTSHLDYPSSSLALEMATQLHMYNVEWHIYFTFLWRTRKRKWEGRRLNWLAFGFLLWLQDPAAVSFLVVLPVCQSGCVGSDSHAPFLAYLGGELKIGLANWWGRAMILRDA